MSLFMMIILFAILIGYGQMILRGVLEEKNSRIIEILLSSTNTHQSLFRQDPGHRVRRPHPGGNLDPVRRGLDRQVFLYAGQQHHQFSDTGDRPLFRHFFILGFFLYAILFSIVGASVNTDQEAQQFSAIITWTMLIPYFIGISVTQNPNSTLATIASLIPLFTPTLMFMRITGSMPSTFQIWISIAATSLTIYLMAWVGAKIFRVGILMYGKKPSLKGDILR